MTRTIPYRKQPRVARGLALVVLASTSGLHLWGIPNFKHPIRLPDRQMGERALAGGLPADLQPMLEDHIANAETIFLVRCQTSEEYKEFPPPPEQRRLLVEKVLKGIHTSQHFLNRADALRPGQQAVLLIQYEHPTHYQPAIQTSRKVDGGRVLWPMQQRRILCGFDGISLPQLIQEIDLITPDEAGLHALALDACLFPMRFEALRSKNPQLATYVAFVVAVRDLDRDVPALALLLESPHNEIRSAAERKLLALTSAKVPRPALDNAPSCQFWSMAWLRWWEKTRPFLVWDEMKNAWIKRTTESWWPREWPPLPLSYTHPPDRFPPELLVALEDADAAAFTRAFRKWIDSGVMRDRLIRAAAAGGPTRLSWGCNVGGAIGQSGPHLPPAALLRRELVFGGSKIAPVTWMTRALGELMKEVRDTPSKSISVKDRMEVLALLSMLWHYERFIAERKLGIKRLEAAAPDSQAVRRAAFWELRDTNIRTPGTVAVYKLAESKDAKSTELLAALFLDALDDDILGAGRSAIRKGNKEFIEALLHCLESNRDQRAGWIGQVLCQEKQQAAIPILIQWLEDKDPAIRKMAADNLSTLPKAEAVPALLVAIKAEKSRSVREQLLVCLARTGDKKGLGVLLAATREKGIDAISEIARGLARIRDKKALPALADLAVKNEEAVKAFGYISGLYQGYEEGYPPDVIWYTLDFQHLEPYRTNLAIIEEWKREKSQPQ